MKMTVVFAALVVVVARGAAVAFEQGDGRANIQTREPMTSEAVLIISRSASTLLLRFCCAWPSEAS